MVDGEKADEDAARTYVERFANLRILGVAEELPEAASEAGRLTVVDGTGELVLTLSHEKEEDDYFIRSSRREGNFKLATYIAEQLLNDKESLLPEQPAAEDSPDTDS